ncbi:MAG: hypothetical protein AB4040_13160 [Synechococcus sp.]
MRTDPNSLGYFGYAYYEASQSALNALGIDSGDGPVLPSDETVRNGTYHPLSRPLFIYVNVDAFEENSELDAFVEYYLMNVRYLVPVVGHTTLPAEAYAIAHEHFMDRRVGTVFAGEARTELTIEELLDEEAAF